MKSTCTVSIVIPNWNGSHLLEKNLPFVLTAAPDAQIIVADDASSDNSLSLLREKFPSVTVVSSKKQQGFAGNVNAGVARASGEIIVLLNTDVRPEKDFLKFLTARFSDPHVAAVGCLEKSHEAGGVILRGRGIASWKKGYFIHKKGEVDKEDTAWVSGGSAAYRRSIWNELGGMDTLYNPFYWEDIDLSYQMLKAGHRIVFENKSVVGHFHEEGKIKTAYTSWDVKKIAYRNQFIFMWKNISDIRLWLLHCFWTPIRLLQAATKGDWLMLNGYLMAAVKLPQVIQSRRRASMHWRLRDMAIFPS